MSDTKEDIGKRFERRRQSQCGSKVKYPDREAAERGAYTMRMQTGRYFDAYECEFCHKFHVGGRRV